MNQQAVRTAGIAANRNAGRAAFITRFRRTAIGLLAGAAYAAPAQAYLDPGTGSILLQSLLAAIAAAAAVCGVFWDRVKSFFGSIFPSKKAPPAPEEPDHDR